MYTEKILGIVNARCKNAGKRQTKYAEKMLGSFRRFDLVGLF